jgi:uncharacterized protein YcbK (DUF882 family)
MHGMSRSTFLTLSGKALPLVPALVLAASTASASPIHGKLHRTARVEADSPRGDAHAPTDAACHGSKPSVEVTAGPESATLSLEKCGGEAIATSVDKLSILARPLSTARPKDSSTTKPGAVDVAPGIRRLDERLVQRIELVAEHFRKEDQPLRIILVTQSKARSAGSYHASGRAIDFRIDGVEDEAVAAFCKTVPDTGCGFYPNGGFVHMDARDPGAGHVSWIDISRPGDPPKYVNSWPLAADTKSDAKEEAPKADGAKTEAKGETKTEAPKAEAKAEKTGKCEAPKAEAKAESTLPALPAASLPAAVQVAPLETPKSEPAAKTAAKSDDAVEPAPVKKHHRRRHHKAVDHTI